MHFINVQGAKAMEILELVCLDTKSKPEKLHVSLKNLNVERSILQIYCDKPAKVRMAWGDIWGDTDTGKSWPNG